mmetsp:Transcript_14961/g.34086  ORF Transcript_14961/g.34086 Transcript_14961/m.34086 type:complete len:248 (+) Transcript_14961:554-1297(+)
MHRVELKHLLEVQSPHWSMRCTFPVALATIDHVLGINIVKAFLQDFERHLRETFRVETSNTTCVSGHEGIVQHSDIMQWQLAFLSLDQNINWYVNVLLDASCRRFCHSSGVSPWRCSWHRSCTVANCRLFVHPLHLGAPLRDAAWHHAALPCRVRATRAVGIAALVGADCQATGAWSSKWRRHLWRTMLSNNGIPLWRRLRGRCGDPSVHHRFPLRTLFLLVFGTSTAILAVMIRAGCRCGLRSGSR